MKKLNLKGIWIPIEILKDESLSDKEKLIYSMIEFLGREKEYCYCTNIKRCEEFQSTRVCNNK